MDPITGAYVGYGAATTYGLPIVRGIATAYKYRKAILGAMALRRGIKRFRNGRWNVSKRSRTSYGGGNPRGNTSGVTPVSAQYDAARIQRARPLDGRSKRYIKRFKRFRKKVRNVQSSDVPDSFVVRQSTRTISTSAAAIPNATQSVASIGFVDNDVIAQAFTASSLNVAVGSEDTLALRSAACELMLSCNAPVGGLQSAQVDVYLVKARKGISTAQSAAPEDQWIAALTALTDTAGNPTPLTWGVTPFEAPAFCKMYKIMQTWRLNLVIGGLPTTLEKTLKLGGRRVMGNSVASTRTLGGTMAWLFVVHGIPNEAVAGGFHGTNVQIRYNQTLHYEQFDPSNARRTKNL